MWEYVFVHMHSVCVNETERVCVMYNKDIADIILFQQDINTTLSPPYKKCVCLITMQAFDHVDCIAVLSMWWCTCVELSKTEML